MRDNHIVIARSRSFVSFCALFTWVALAYGIIVDVLALELLWTETFAYRRMVSVSRVLSIATILSNILLLPMACSVW